ncbi:MAG: DUF1236 domain-containing protein [Shinella sp.]|nr:DUF1236 domain-containing protein [Shinella sp.]
MKLKLVLMSAIAVGALSMPAYADDDGNDSAVTGAAGGAVTGAIVGGPVGAAVGGVAGAVAGAAIDPPPRKVITYVERQPVPSDTVVIEEPIEIGRPIPQTVVLTPVPDDPAYAYAVVNNQRVIVDPQTHTVVEIIR